MRPPRIRRSKPGSLLPGFFSDDDFLVAGILLELPELVLRECLPHKGVSSSSPSWGATKKRSTSSGHPPSPSLHPSSSPDPVPNPKPASPPLVSAAGSNAGTNPTAAPRNPSPPAESDVTDSNHSARSMNSPDPAREWPETVNGFTHCRGQPNGSAAKRRDPKAGKPEVCLLPESAGARKRRPGIRRNTNAAVGMAKSMTPNPRCQQQASVFFRQLPSETAAASEDEGCHRYGHCETASFGHAVNHVEDPPPGGFDLNLPAWEAAAVECFHPSDVSGCFAVVDDPRARSKEARRRRVEIQRMKSHCLRHWPPAPPR